MIDVCSQERKPLLSIDEALDKIKATIQPIVEAETIALQNDMNYCSLLMPAGTVTPVYVLVRILVPAADTMPVWFDNTFAREELAVV